MTSSIEFIDIPTVEELETHIIETFKGNKERHTFIRFLWHEKDYWLIGKPVWKNVCPAGHVQLRLPRGKRFFKVRLTVRHWANPLRFSIGHPAGRKPSQNAFVFVGFCPDRIVDINFVREEEKRLKKTPDDYASFLQKSISAPRKGKII
jgi:hypothetical protein